MQDFIYNVMLIKAMFFMFLPSQELFSKGSSNLPVEMM